MTIKVSRRNLIGAASIGSAAILSGTRLSAAAEPTPASTVSTLFGPDRGVALLSRNENPYGPAASAIQAMADTASKGCYYADKGYFRLRDMIAERFSLDAEHVIVSSGSTEALCSAALAWGSEGTILCPELFWDTTVLYAEQKGAKIKRVPLGADMGIDLDAPAAGIDDDTSLVHSCNPNNPTGMVLDGDELRAFIRKVGPKVTVLVDEAYNELTDDPEYSSVAELVREGENLIVCRTFSKIYGMAGLRVGYALTSPEKAELIQSYLMSFGGNSAGLAAAIASYNDTAFTTSSKGHVTEAREMMLDAVGQCGLTALPSETNFIYVKVPDADALQKALAEQQIMIRGSYGEQWDQWSRASTGKIEDVKRYTTALKSYFGV